MIYAHCLISTQYSALNQDVLMMMMMLVRHSQNLLCCGAESHERVSSLQEEHLISLIPVSLICDLIGAWRDPNNRPINTNKTQPRNSRRSACSLQNYEPLNNFIFSSASLHITFLSLWLCVLMKRVIRYLYWTGHASKHHQAAAVHTTPDKITCFVVLFQCGERGERMTN